MKKVACRHSSSKSFEDKRHFFFLIASLHAPGDTISQFEFSILSLPMAGGYWKPSICQRVRQPPDKLGNPLANFPEEIDNHLQKCSNDELFHLF
jgi:hypothetical protein